MLNGNETGGGRGLLLFADLLRRARGSAVRLFGFLGSKTSKGLGLRFVSGGDRRLTASRAAQLTPSADCEHLSEAMEDCIKFLHSSSRKA